MKIAQKISLGLGVCVLAVSAAATAQEVKLAVVNIERLVSQSPQFLAAQAKMEDEFAPKARELRSRQETFQQKVEQLQRDAEVMGQAEREAASAVGSEDLGGRIEPDLGRFRLAVAGGHDRAASRASAIRARLASASEPRSCAPRPKATAPAFR